MSSLFLLFCCVLLSLPVTLSSVFEAPVYPLELTGLQIRANGTCTSGEVCNYNPSGGNLNCEECTPTNFSPESAIDGNRDTKWVSMPSFQSPSLVLYLDKDYNISSVELLSRRLPLSWTLDYSTDDGVSFSPWAAVVEQDGDCQNLAAMYPLCENSTMIEIHHLSFEADINLEDIPMPSALKFTFIKPAELLTSDSREEFYEVQEILMVVVCEDAIALFDNTNDCPGINRIYSPKVPILEDIQKNGAKGQFIWSQKGEPPISPLGAWYLDDVVVSNVNGGRFNDSFESNQIDLAVWSASGARLSSAPCSAPPPLDQVLLFSEQTSSDRSREASLTVQPQTEIRSVQFVLGFLDPSLQCGNEFGDVELSYCNSNSSEEFQLVGVFVLNDCGDCVNKHLLRLRVHITDIQTTLSQLPLYAVLIVGNTTDLSLISSEQAELNLLISKWLKDLTPIEKMYGFPSEYPKDITLDVSVAVIENLTSVLDMFSRFCELVDNITMFSHVRNTSSEMLERANKLTKSVATLRNNESSLRIEVEDLIENLSILFNQLTDHLDAISLAVAEGNSSLKLIESRQYNSLDNQTDQLTLESTKASLNVSQYLELANNHTERLKDIINRLNLSKEHLEAVVNVSEGIIEDSADVMLDVDAVETVLREIQGLVYQAHNLTTLINKTLSSANRSASFTRDILSSASRTVEATEDSLESLKTTVQELTTEIGNYSSSLDEFIPEAYPLPCELGSKEDVSCLSGELHAKRLELNSSRINSAESVSTRLYAEEFLNSLKDISGIDLEDINKTATEAISIASKIISSLEESGLGQLSSDVKETNTQIQILSINVSNLLNDSMDGSSAAQTEFNRSVVLQREVADIEADFNLTQQGIAELENMQNYTSKAEGLIETASNISNTLSDVNDTLWGIEGEIPSLEERAKETIMTVRNARETLDYSEEQVLLVKDFISATHQTLNQTRSNLDDTLQQNNGIINDISSLLLSVDATHELLKRVNSPVTFKSSGSNKPFISLQPPPGIGNSQEELQLDSLEIYLNGNQDKNSLIFYAGPLIEEGAPESDSALASEDFLSVVDEGTEVSVQWRLGQKTNEIKEITVQSNILDQSQVYLRRVGSMFELTVTSGGGAKSAVNLTLVEGSLLFRMSQNTAFLVGGRPPNAKLAIPNNGSISGTLDLILYNGRLWSLWDYRRRSETDFTGSYMQHEAVQNNIYGPDGIPVSVLSFNGNGYLRPKQFLSVVNSQSKQYKMFINFIPNSLEGLMVYLFEPNTSVSIEVALSKGKIQIILLKGVQRDIFIRELNNVDDTFASKIILSFLPGAVLINTAVYKFSGFKDLNDVQAWYGGVVESQLPELFHPNITTGFHGCVYLRTEIIGGSRVSISSDKDFFISNYLNSPIQKGMSATCLKSNYADQVSFSGTKYLSYRSLSLVTTEAEKLEAEKLEAGGPKVSSGDQLTIALSFLPMKNSCVLFAAIQDSRKIVVELKNGLVQANIENQPSPVILSSTQVVALSQWHHLILEIRNQSHSKGEGLRLFVDNQLADSKIINGFTFFFPLKSSITSNPVLHIGRAPNRNSSDLFEGCMKDFVLNLLAMNFLSASLTILEERDGITFHKCLFVPPKMQAGLSLALSKPESQICGNISEPEILSSTIGGFHALSQAFSYNVLPLQSSVWNVQLMLRRYSLDGHVITFPSDDVTISLFIENGGIRWHLLKKDSSTSSSTVTPISSGTWHEVRLNCSVAIPSLTCFSHLDGSVVDTFSQDTERAYFMPELPVTLGRTEQDKSFVGCIRDVLINGKSTGYDLEDLSTCEQCYAGPIDGWGLTGRGYLMKSVSSQSNYSINFSFKPTRDHGLLLYLSNSAPLFAMGLNNGELRLTNFTQSGSFNSFTGPSLCSLESFHNISVDVSGGYVSVFLTLATGKQSNMTIQIADMVNNNLDVYIGGIEDDFQDISHFDFLLVRGGIIFSSSEIPNFIGCLKAVEVTAGPSSLNLLAQVSDADQYINVLDGLCPN